MRSILPVTAAALLIGFSSIDAIAQQLKSTQRLIATANEACSRQYPDAARQAPARAKCEDENARIMQERTDRPDLLDAELAYKIALAEKVRSRRITQGQATAAFAKYRSEDDVETNRRSTREDVSRLQEPAARDVVSPRSAAAPADVATSADETTNCTVSGDQINCDNGLSGFRVGDAVIWSDGVTSYSHGDRIAHSGGMRPRNYGNGGYFRHGPTVRIHRSSPRFGVGHGCRTSPYGRVSCR